MATSCGCGSGEISWWEFDGRGIPLTRVCTQCEKEKLDRFSSVIREPYSQGDVDCRIEPEDA